MAVTAAVFGLNYAAPHSIKKSRMPVENPSRTILIVEDNEDDVFAMKRALVCAQIKNPVQVVTDGQQALEYLSGSGDYSDPKLFPAPFLVFLDLKLPFVHGFEVLEWIRQQPALRQVVVVVLTSSAEKRDYEKACALGARKYLVKPPTPDMLREVMTSLGSLFLAGSESTPVSLPADLDSVLLTITPDNEQARHSGQ
jgi:CheY-like chemotaxis protein